VGATQGGTFLSSSSASLCGLHIPESVTLGPVHSPQREKDTCGLEIIWLVQMSTVGQTELPRKASFLPSSMGWQDKQLYVSALLPWVSPSVPLNAGERHPRDRRQRRGTPLPWHRFLT